MVVVAGIILLWKRPRADLLRGGIVIWGGWLVVTAGVFSFMQGTFHEYYTVALTPAIGALTGLGVALVVMNWQTGWVRILSAITIAVTGIWAAAIVWQAGGAWVALAVIVAVCGLLAAAGILLHGTVSARGARSVARATIATAAVAVLAAPAAFAVETAVTGRDGSIITAGPLSRGGGPGGAGAQGGPGGAGAHGGPGGGGPGVEKPSDELIATLSDDGDQYTWVAAAVGSMQSASYQLYSGYSVMPIGGFTGSDPSPTLEEFQQMVSNGEIHYFIARGNGGGAAGGHPGSQTSANNGERGGDQASLGGSEGPGGQARPGGPGGQARPGGDGGNGPGGEKGTSSEISSWVQENFNSIEIDGTTLYDLTSPKASASESTSSTAAGQTASSTPSTSTESTEQSASRTSSTPTEQPDETNGEGS